jgi:hypothetical protein
MASRISVITTLLGTALTLTVKNEGDCENIDQVTKGTNDKACFVEYAGSGASNPLAQLTETAFRVTLCADSIANLETLLDLVLKFPKTYTVSATSPYMVDVYEGGVYYRHGGDWLTTVFLQTYWRLS